MLKYDFCRVSYSLSKATIVSAVHWDLDLYFQGHVLFKIYHILYPENGESQQTTFCCGVALVSHVAVLLLVDYNPTIDRPKSIRN